MNESCPIWGTPASIKPPTEHGSTVDSPRTGGRYSISSSAQAMLIDLDERSKSRLTSWLIEQRRQGTDCPKIGSEEIERERHSKDTSVHDRANNLLRFFQSQTLNIGAEFYYQEILDKTELEHAKSLGLFVAHPQPKDEDIIWKMLAHSESSSFRELQFLLDYLVDQSWLDCDGSSTHSRYKLTVKGYGHLAEIDHITKDSSQAFVAMWFHESMNEIWENGFCSAIKDTGYKPVRIDKKEHVNKIDDEIIAEIKRSVFLIADFTQGEDGARGGVYYEAGFARGLDIPVIFTCREDVLDKIHFDVRQYNTITWNENKLNELREKLKNRISAVIGDGPLRN